jgi:hypothetical protein
MTSWLHVRNERAGTSGFAPPEARICFGGDCFKLPCDRCGAAVWLLPAEPSAYETESMAKAEFLAETLGATGMDTYRRIIDFMQARAAAAVGEHPGPRPKL